MTGDDAMLAASVWLATGVGAVADLAGVDAALLALGCCAVGTDAVAADDFGAVVGAVG